MATVLDKLVTILGYEVDDKGLKKAKQRLESVQKGFDNTANKVGIAGAGLTAGLFAVGRSVLQFERSMNELQAATNVSAEEMAEMRKQAMEMGRTTKFSASQAADAQVELGRAGLSTSQIIETLPGVLSLAAAGNLQMSEAAAIATSTIAGFGLETGEAGRVADVLAAAASSAKTDVSQMGFALSKVAPTAQSLGVDLETTAASLAVLQNNGIKAEEAGTGLRNVLARLVNPSTAAREALAGVGVDADELSDIVGEGNLSGAMQLLADAGLDTKAAFEIFGAEAANQATILINSTGKVNELKTAYDGAAGSAERMAQQQMMGLPGAVDTLTSKFEGLLLTLGDAGVTAALIKMANFLGNVTDAFANADPVVQKIIAAALTLGPALLGLAGFLKIVSGAIAVFNALLFANPIGLIILAITAVIGAITALIVYWDEVIDAFKAGFSVIGDIVDSVGGLLGFESDEETDAPDIGPGQRRANNGAPVVPPGLAQAQQYLASNRTNVNNANVEVGDINLTIPGADSTEIASNVGTIMRDQLRNTAQNFDSTEAE